MDKFILFLSTKRIGSEKQRAFFVQWVKSFLSFSASAQNSDERRKYIDPFLEKMAKTKEDWQVKQAKRSILLYFHSITHAKYKTSEQNIKTNSDWSHAIEQMVHAMRLRHLSHRTEKTYINWMRQFYRHVRGQAPKDLGTRHVTDFLTYLAVDRKVSASTQNQAFSAILFFFRRVLNQEVGELSQSIRARRGRRLPVVLSRSELDRLFNCMHGVTRLIAQLMYGAGLRSNECLQLRVKDIDFNRGCIIVRSGKGNKDRMTLFPERLHDAVRRHLKTVKALHIKDRQAAFKLDPV